MAEPDYEEWSADFVTGWLLSRDLLAAVGNDDKNAQDLVCTTILTEAGCLQHIRENLDVLLGALLGAVSLSTRGYAQIADLTKRDPLEILQQDLLAIAATESGLRDS